MIGILIGCARCVNRDLAISSVDFHWMLNECYRLVAHTCRFSQHYNVNYSEQDSVLEEVTPHLELLNTV